MKSGAGSTQAVDVDLKPGYTWQTHLGEAIPFDAKYHEVPRTEIVSFIHRSPGVVLDVGCAGGATSRLIKQKFPGTRVIGVEPNRDAARHASQYLDKVLTKLLSQIDPEVDLEGCDIGLVLLLDVLEHIEDPWRALSGLRQLIGMNTRVLASIPNVRNLSTMHDLAAGKWEYLPNGVLDITHLRFFTEKQIRELFLQTGYRILAVDPLTNPESMKRIVTAERTNRVETARIAVDCESFVEHEGLYAIQYVVDARKSEG